MESTLTRIICPAEPLNLLITVILPQCSYRHTHCYVHAHVCVWVSGLQWRIRVCNEYWPKEDRLHWVIWLQKREGRLMASEIETKRDTLTDSHFSEQCTVVWVYSSRWLINYAQHIDIYVWFRFDFNVHRHTFMDQPNIDVYKWPLFNFNNLHLP